jgi:hypothetical protein
METCNSVFVTEILAQLDGKKKIHKVNTSKSQLALILFMSLLDNAELYSFFKK